MSAPYPTSLAFVWHHRVLGALWALGGLMTFVVGLRRAHWWENAWGWVPPFLGMVYLIAGVGFILARTWARRVMAVLVVLAGLLFAHLFLIAWGGEDVTVFRWMVPALGFAFYTAAFIVISADLRSWWSP